MTRRAPIGSGASAWLAALAIVLAACAATPQGPSAGASAPSEPARSVPPSAPATASPSPTTTPAASPSALAAALSWSRLEAAGPAAREDHTWTVGPDETAYLFGGRDGATVFGDLWAYDLATDAWTRLSPASGPPARFGHDAAWVDGVGFVVFAGQAGATFFADLWAYDPATNAWTQLPGNGAVPTPRYGTCAALGPDGRLWISHGFTSDGSRFSDTRAYDFANGTWADETPDGVRPVERCLHGCWWTDAGQLALYAGQTTGVPALGDLWLLDPDAGWTEAEPPDASARNLPALVRVEGGTVAIGGQGSDLEFATDAWLKPDDGPARLLEPSGSAPGGRAGAAAIADADRGRILLFGGRDGSGARDDLWELGPTSSLP